jgi:hypothetical protein
VRKVELASGRVLHSTPMDSRWFGEGMTRLGDRLYQITWLTNTGFIYSVPGLQRVRGGVGGMAGHTAQCRKGGGGAVAKEAAPSTTTTLLSWRGV